MPVIRNTKHYTQIHNDAIRDKNLSLKARGLHHFMLAIDDFKDIRIDYLIAQTGGKRLEIVTALDELERLGYVKKTATTPNETYEVYQLPDFNNNF